jgi:hypothetical protein
MEEWGTEQSCSFYSSPTAFTRRKKPYIRRGRRAQKLRIHRISAQRWSDKGNSTWDTARLTFVTLTCRLMTCGTHV